MRIFKDGERIEMAARYLAGESLNSLIKSYRSNYADITRTLIDAGVELRSQAQAWSVSVRAGGTVNTPIELRLHDALRAVGIGFTTQVLLLGKYLPDVLLNQAPVVIEADGSVHLVDSVRVKDKRRDQELTAAGYRIFRFTGSQLNRDAVACVRTVITACGLTPEHDPVFDIRTSFSGPDHPRWKGGLTQFTCSNAKCSRQFSKARKHRQGELAFCCQKCYGRWLTDHPEANNAKLKKDWTGLRELYEAGMSIKQLGEHFGCSNRGVSTAMRDLGIPVRPMGGPRIKGGRYKAGGKAA